MKSLETTTHHTPLAQVVLAFYEAVKDSRTEDALLLVDPEVTCFPLVRPGLTAYHGHQGIASFITYMHAAYGDYQIEIEGIRGEVPGDEVTVRARFLPEPGYQQSPGPVVSRYTFRDGRIASFDSDPAPN